MSMENLVPYSNFHELNQDWFLNEFNKLVEQWKAMQKNFDSLQDAFNDLKSYVQDYFKNMDVQDEINKKLDELVNNGRLDYIFNNYIFYTSVKMFGAKGDGVTDDTEAFKKFINDPSTIKVIPKGKYLITESIVVNNKYTRISGVGDDSIILNRSNSYAFILSNTYKTTIESLQIQCDNNDGIFFRDDGRQGFSSIKNITLNNYFRYGVLFSANGGYNNIYNCNFNSNALSSSPITDIFIGGSTQIPGVNYVKILNCNFECATTKTTRNNIVISQCNVCDILECDFANNVTNYCIKINATQGDCANINIYNNKFWYCKKMFFISRPTTNGFNNLSIHDNLFSGNTPNEILTRAESETYYISGVSFYNNTFNDNLPNLISFFKLNYITNMSIGETFFNSNTLTINTCKLSSFNNTSFSGLPKINMIAKKTQTEVGLIEIQFDLSKYPVDANMYIPTIWINHEGSSNTNFDKTFSYNKNGIVYIHFYHEVGSYREYYCKLI